MHAEEEETMVIRTKAVHAGARAEVLEQVERLLETSLSKFSRRIARVEAWVVDLNGPRGGVDKSLRIRVHMRPRGSLFIEETDAEVRTAADRAADRAATAIARTLDRSRTLHRGRKARREARTFRPLEAE
jgi:putative sigma-54 modulation protein